MNSGIRVTLSISLFLTVFVIHSIIIAISGDITSQWAVILVTAFSSAALIRLTTKAIDAGLSNNNFVLEKVLGGSYVRGTWGGRIKSATGRDLIFVEKYEQTTLKLTVRGWSFEGDNDNEDAWWVSKCATIDEKEGRIFILYETHITKPKIDGEDIRYGTGRFNFTKRKSVNGPALRMKGIAVDEFLTNGLVYEDVFKLSPDLLDLDIARQQVLRKINSPNVDT